MNTNQLDMKRNILIVLSFLISQNLFSQTISNCSTCSRDVLNESQLSEKSLEELALLRNEIMARKGYVFSTQKYAQYFENQSWYKPVQSNTEIKLSEIENKNIEIIQKLEVKEKTKRDRALNDLKELKNALNSNNETIIKKYLSKLTRETGNYDALISELKEAFSKIDLNNIHWNKNSGLYKVTIDNGRSISRYEILFGYDTVSIKYGIYARSEIVGGYEDGYSDYMPEEEYQIWYEFNMTENGIIFDYWGGAG